MEGDSSDIDERSLIKTVFVCEPFVDNDKIESRVRFFVREYLGRGRKLEAAAEVAGITNPHEAVQTLIVKREMARQMVMHHKRNDITQDRILNEMACIAFFDPAEMFGVDNELLAINEMSEHTRRAISTVEVEELYEGRGRERTQVGFTRKVKLHDKVKGLEMLGKHLALFPETVNTVHSGKVETETKVIGLEGHLDRLFKRLPIEAQYKIKEEEDEAAQKDLAELLG